jgi:sigma-B regulation protein RsbU (phosphoserine phosphatase)
MPNKTSALANYAPAPASTSQEEVVLLRSLVEASKMLNSTLDLDELLKLILQVATENTGADRGTIYLVDKKRKEIWSRLTNDAEVVEIRLPLSQGIAGHVASTGEIVALDNVYDDPRFDRSTDMRTGYRTRTMLCMPLRDKEREIIGVFQILNKKNGTFNQQDAVFLDALSTHAAIALENARLYQEALEKKRLEGEISVAREIQQRLLPAKMPEFRGFEFAAKNIPTFKVGGDYYDFLPLPDGRLAFAIGDVSGKGIPAALLMSSLRAGFQTQLREDKSLTSVADKLNRLIFHCTSMSSFITFFFGVIHPKKKYIDYINCGHNPPYVLLQSGKLKDLRDGGLVLGMVDDAKFSRGRIVLSPGEMLVSFTDGVTEALNKRGRLFGEKKLEKLILKNRKREAVELLEIVFKAVQKHIGEAPQSDDITALIIRRNA